MNLHYESRLEDLDELKFVRDSLQLIQTQQADYFKHLMTGYTNVTTPEDRQAFDSIMTGVDGLIEEEKQVLKKCEEIDKKNY